MSHLTIKTFFDLLTSLRSFLALLHNSGGCLNAPFLVKFVNNFLFFKLNFCSVAFLDLLTPNSSVYPLSLFFQQNFLSFFFLEFLDLAVELISLFN